MKAPPRSLLFIPASRPEFVAKAHLRGADAIILDLEDGVAPADKAAARERLGDLHASLRAAGLAVWIRINALSAGGLEDLEVVGCLHDDPIVMLPKAESPAEVHAAAERMRESGSNGRIAPLIETPAGILAAAQIAGADCAVVALAFGSEDFAASLGVPPVETALAMPAQWVVLAAASKGLPAFGLPGTLAAFDDPDALAVLAAHAATLGFAGALCVHPAQVAVINRCFSPSAEALSWALRIQAHAASHEDGATGLDGRMVDPPILARAMRVIDRARAARLMS